MAYIVAYLCNHVSGVKYKPEYNQLLGVRYSKVPPTRPQGGLYTPARLTPRGVQLPSENLHLSGLAIA